MKKSLVFFLSIFLFLTFQSNSFAFILDFESSWFYSSIDENISSLENNLYSVELQNNWPTWEQINSISWNNCLNWDLSQREISEVVNNWNISIINSKISEECIDWDWRITLQTSTAILRAVNRLYSESSQISEEKADKLINFWNTWIYSDWIEENSPFDLVKTLEKIDSIIFSEPSSVYESNVNFDLLDKVKQLSDKAEEKNREIDNISSIDEENINNQIALINESFNSNIYNINNVTQNNLYSKYNCWVINWTSWLSLKNTIEVKNQINWENQDNSNTDSENSNTNSNTSNSNNNSSNNQNNWEYNKINDNSVFPCDNIFCIDIEFITYNHNLLGWWVNDISIEYLVNRSNKHLRKFASTSLIQSKMTLNNFELWLKDLNLPDIFHLWFQVSTKPVPILDIQSEENNDKNSMFWLESQLEFYYDSYWLDYSRRNDLSLFENMATKNQIWNNSNFWSVNTFNKNSRKFNEYRQSLANQRETMRLAIENMSQWNNMTEFEKQFKEISIFNKNINDYVNNMSAIIKNMNKIPVDIWEN